MKIYSTIHDFLPGAIQLLQETGHNISVRSENEGRPSETELCEIVSKYDGIILSVHDKMTQKVYEHAKNLKFIGTLSIGIDHIDDNFLKDSQIKLINCALSNVPSVTEFTFSLILELVKNLNAQHEYTIGHRDHKPDSHDLYGKYLGVVGAGNTAQSVIKIGLAFGMSILCWTFHPENHKDLVELGVQFIPIDELFEKSEVLSIHIPLTKDTKGLIDKSLLEKLPKDSIFINTSRLDIVDNLFLADLLSSNKIGGIGIDGDFTKDLVNKFKGMKNVRLTSHVAGTNVDADRRIDMDMAHQIIITF